MSRAVDALLRALPVLKDAHSYVVGLSFDGTARSLEADLRRAAVSVEGALRAAMKSDRVTPADRLAVNAALRTLVAMDEGSMPYDADRAHAAREVLKTAVLGRTWRDEAIALDAPTH